MRKPIPVSPETLRVIAEETQHFGAAAAAIEAEREGSVVSFGGCIMHWATSAVLMLGAPPCQLEAWEEAEA